MSNSSLKKFILKELTVLAMRRSMFLTFVVLIGLFAEVVALHHAKVLDAEAKGLKQIMAYEVEQSYRTQARFDLVQGSACIRRIMSSNMNKDSTFDDRLFEAVDICMSKERTTNTGDAFMIDLQTFEFKYDPSLDCFVEGGKRFVNKQEAVKINGMLAKGEKVQPSQCEDHYDVEQCYAIQNKLTMGYDSKPGDDLWFNFDGAPEWLEYVVIPAEDVGFDGLSRGLNSKQPAQYVLVLGIQSDEVWKQFKHSNAHMEEFIQDASNISLVKWSIRLLIVLCLIYAIYIGHADRRAFMRIKCNADKG